MTVQEKMQDVVVIIGASARAAAMSARRAGWTPWCADLFADIDLQRVATVRKIPADAYPRGLLDALADAPRGPVIYTGALENRPDLIARIDRPLWGNTPDVLRAVRSPERWTHFLRDHGINCPDISNRPQTAGDWLIKPRRGAGGLGIHEYRHRRFNSRTYFLQQRIDGLSCSAVFVSQEIGARLCGVTRQLIGVSWLNANGFQYCGNIGPLPIDAATKNAWERLGTVASLTVRGVFGIDAVIRDDRVVPIEINPRYTASVEILERGRRPLVPFHRAAFEGSVQTRESLAHALGSDTTVCGKAILYARRTFTFPERGPWLAALEPGVDFDSVDYADIPHPGEVIEQGRPVLTLFASALSANECEAALQEKARALDQRLWG